MSEDDHNYYGNQRLIPQIGYCSTFTERKWATADKRRKMLAVYYGEKKRELDIPRTVSVDLVDGEDPVVPEYSHDFEPASNDRYQFETTPHDTEDPLPDR